MIREKIKYTDFYNVAKDNEYFLWHFIQKEQHLSNLGLSSIIDSEKDENPLKDILENLDIPYYESYTEDSLDFLHGLGFRYDILYQNKIINPPPPRNFRFSPVLIGFKKFTKKLSTLDLCYCTDGIIEIIGSLHPKYLEQIISNIEKNHE